MASSLSSLVDNLSEGIHKIKCKNGDCLFEYGSVRDNLIKYKCFFRNKNYSNKMKNLKSDLKIHLSFLIMISINLF